MGELDETLVIVVEELRLCLELVFSSFFGCLTTICIVIQREIFFSRESKEKRRERKRVLCSGGRKDRIMNKEMNERVYELLLPLPLEVVKKRHSTQVVVIAAAAAAVVAIVDPSSFSLSVVFRCIRLVMQSRAMANVEPKEPPASDECR